MAQSNGLGDSFRCVFCGAENAFTENELYTEQADGSRVIKEKFCKYCGEILIKGCSVCSTTMILDSIIKTK